MSGIRVTESELLAELRRECAIDHDAPPEAMTVSEICEALGLGSNAVNKKIAKWRAEGRIKQYRVYRYDAQGRPHPAAAYVLLPGPTQEKPAPKRKRA